MLFIWMLLGCKEMHKCKGKAKSKTARKEEKKEGGSPSPELGIYLFSTAPLFAEITGIMWQHHNNQPCKHKSVKSMEGLRPCSVSCGPD